MKFSLEWLKSFLETDAGVTDIAAALNRIGHEVEGVEDPSEKLEGFRIAKVLTAAKHPDADKLQALTVDAMANRKVVSSIENDIDSIPDQFRRVSRGEHRWFRLDDGPASDPLQFSCGSHTLGSC